MRLSKFSPLYAALGSLFLSACQSGPEVDVCLSYPEKGGFICVDQKQNPYFMEYAKTLKYVAFSPADAQKLIESCGLSKKQKQLVREYYRDLEVVADRHRGREACFASDNS